MKFLLVAALGATLLLPMHVNAFDAEPPANSAELSSEELVAQLRGSSYSHPMLTSGVAGSGTRSVTFQEEFAYANWVGPGGRPLSATGRWQVRGSTFCISFPQQEECHQVRRAGGDLWARFKPGWTKLKKE